MPGDCIVVYFLKPQPPGYEFARTRDDWPLHITLVPWFGNVAVEDIRAALQKCAEAVKPFTLVLGEDRWLPKTHAISVCSTLACSIAWNRRAPHCESTVGSGGSIRRMSLITKTTPDRKRVIRTR
jgi:hypothetical protein